VAISLYAGGITVRDISPHLHRVYHTAGPDEDLVELDG
jgi:hypothetical protein